MAVLILVFLSILGSCVAIETAPGIFRTVSTGAESRGFKIIYGDEDYTLLNDIVNDAEMKDSKSKINLNELITPLPAEDVKCLMSVDSYCSKSMKEMKRILIHAVKDECKNCTKKQREEAGKIVAAMLAHDKSAWKMFLTRAVIATSPVKERRKRSKELKLEIVGEGEEVHNPKKYRFLLPGFKVRVKRYDMKVE